MTCFRDLPSIQSNATGSLTIRYFRINRIRSRDVAAVPPAVDRILQLDAEKSGRGVMPLPICPADDSFIDKGLALRSTHLMHASTAFLLLCPQPCLLLVPAWTL